MQRFEPRVDPSDENDSDMAANDGITHGKNVTTQAQKAGMFRVPRRNNRHEQQHHYHYRQ